VDRVRSRFEWDRVDDHDPFASEPAAKAVVRRRRNADPRRACASRPVVFHDEIPQDVLRAETVEFDVLDPLEAQRCECVAHEGLASVRMRVLSAT
jgi:hypothetical protein